MSKTLILLVSIFGLWLFISFTKDKKKDEKESKKDFVPADDDINFVSADKNKTLVAEVTA